MDFQGSWNHYISLVEFAYNNSFQATIGVASYELLYGRKCRSSENTEMRLENDVIWVLIMLEIRLRQLKR